LAVIKIPQSVFDTLAKRRSAALESCELLRAEIYSRDPRFFAIDGEIASSWSGILSVSKEDTPSAVAAVRKRVEALADERRALLAALGYPEDALSPRFTCPVCEDTGFVQGRRCRCCEELIKKDICRTLPPSLVAEAGSFESFDLSFYPDTPCAGGVSPRRNMTAILERCKKYAADFPNNGESLVFMGRTGLGKTHLSISIAAAVMEKGYSVFYGTAQSIIDRQERLHFNRSPLEEDPEASAQIAACDLLIIDDLGAEFSTSFSQAVIYNIINDRINSGLSTIISTNLDIERFSELYSERIASRMLCGFTCLNFTGKDIRLEKKLRAVRSHT